MCGFFTSYILLGLKEMAVKEIWFPDASPDDFQSCPCQTRRSFKWQGFSHWIVFIQPEMK